MNEERKIIFNQETEEDEVYSLSLRPQSLNDFVGQKELVNSLSVSIQAAQLSFDLWHRIDQCPEVLDLRLLLPQLGTQ